MHDAWDVGDSAAPTTLTLVVREDGEVVDGLDMPQALTPEAAMAQLPHARAFLRKLTAFVKECEATVIEHMEAEGAREIPGFALVRRTEYVVIDPRGFAKALVGLVACGKLAPEDYEKAVAMPAPVEPVPTFDNRTLNSLAAKRGGAVAATIRQYRSEVLGVPRLKVTA